MTTVIFLIVGAGALGFVTGCLVRTVRYAAQPPHLRWELYPVPHEAGDRASHGGSRYEETDWWTRPRNRRLAGDVWFMVPEMVFMRGLWEANRPLWYRSFPFHFGLYLLAVAAALVVATAGVTIAVPSAAGGALEHVARVLYRPAGLGGAALAFLGALALLHRRATDRALRLYSTPADFFNLASFAVVLALLGTGCAAAGPGFPGVLTFTRAFLRFDTSVPVPPLLGIGLVLASLLLAYIPLTHMSHFVAKYFTYHAVRWDDAPATDGRALARRIAACLAMRPTWSAPHVGADGAKTWLDVATADPGEGTKT